MEESLFFKHDYNARTDPKMQELLMAFDGPEGIGIYWCIIEQLYEQNGVLPLTSVKSMAYMLHVKSEAVEAVISDFGLFENDGEVFWSNSVNRRIGKRNKISETRSAAARKRWNDKPAEEDEEPENDAKAMQKQCKSNAPAEGAEGVCNAIKVKIEDKDIKESIEKKAPGPDITTEILNMYAGICKNFKPVPKLTKNMREKVERVFNEEMGSNMAVVKTIFEKMNASKFLQGKGRKKFTASFIWLFEESHWWKVLDGAYDDDASNPAETTATEALKSTPPTEEERREHSRRLHQQIEERKNSFITREEYERIKAEDERRTLRKGDDDKDNRTAV